MPELINPLATVKKISAALVQIPKGICPFAEAPSVNRDKQQEPAATGAQELFSLFTADIIKAKTLFVR